MVMPMSSNRENSMFPPYDFDYAAYEDGCVQSYNVKPRPRWVTTEFGGHVSMMLSSFYKALSGSFQSLHLFYLLLICSNTFCLFWITRWDPVYHVADLPHYVSSGKIRWETCSGKKQNKTKTRFLVSYVKQYPGSIQHVRATCWSDRNRKFWSKNLIYYLTDHVCCYYTSNLYKILSRKVSLGPLRFSHILIWNILVSAMETILN